MKTHILASHLITINIFKRNDKVDSCGITYRRTREKQYSRCEVSVSEFKYEVGTRNPNSLN